MADQTKIDETTRVELEAAAFRRLVEHLRARIDELDAEKSGLFFNYDGNSIPW